MKISYEIALADHQATNRAVWRRSFFSRYDLIIWPIFALLSAFVVASSDSGSEVCGLAQTLFGYSAVLAIVLCVLKPIRPYPGFSQVNQSANRMSDEPPTENPSNGIIEVMPAPRETSYPFSRVTGIGEDAAITLFYRKGPCFIFFPTSALNPERRVEFDEVDSCNGIRRWS